MLLQSTIPQSPLPHHHRHVSLSSPLSYSTSFPTGFNTSFFLRTGTAHNKNPIVRCSISQIRSYGTGDYDRRPISKWTGLYRSISLMKDPEIGAASVLSRAEKEGKGITKWELHRIIKELRKFRRYKAALEVYEWMTNKAEKFGITTSDTAIQLDLIAHQHGTLSAEDYFLKLPDTSKDKRTYGALLHAYGKAKMEKKALSLIEEMKIRGFSMNSLEFNTMMSLYMNLKEYDKVGFLVSEMKQKNIRLNMYSYNIWLSSCGGQGSVEKMEQVFEQMKLDSTVNPNWTTFSAMATVYIDGGQLEKAEDYLKKLESRITGPDIFPYNHLISLYGRVGKKEEVYRVWNICKSIFPGTPVMGYHTMIVSLLRLGDIEGAEQLYAEWLSVNPTNDPRIVNLLMSYYVRNGLLVKAEALFNNMVELGGKPNSATWEILAERHLREKRVSEALSCLKEAVLVRQSSNWKIRPVNVSSILSICKKNEDTENTNILMGLLSQLGCSEDAAYMSYIPSGNAVASAAAVATGDEDRDGDGAEMLLN